MYSTSAGFQNLHKGVGYLYYFILLYFMPEKYSGFMDLDYIPKETDLIAKFYVEPSNTGFDNAAQAVAAESSVGTWTHLTTTTKNTERLKAKVFYKNEVDSTIQVAYPLELFEEKNIPQLMSSVAGNVFGMKIVENLKLLDLKFPEKYLKQFSGPKYGIEGIRKISKVKERPFVGTIVKPKLSLSPKEHSVVAYNAWIGGCDIVKDDENLSSQSFNPFNERLSETIKAKEKAEKETGEKKFYLCNITAPYSLMLERAKAVQDIGNEYAMVDVLTIGFSALQELLDQDLDLIWHAHRAMHASMTRNQKHGISMLVLAKLFRLIGLDQIHIGTYVGKMKEGKEEVQKIGEEIESHFVSEEKGSHALSEDWLHIKPMLAVCSGGLFPGSIPSLVEMLGKDIVVQAGGGIHGHPKGTKAGAKAMRDAAEAANKGLTLEEAAKNSVELKQALEHWKDY